MNCLHKYTQQLNPFPHCNPYERGIMFLECTAEVPPDASDITIGWFLNCEQLTNSTNVTIQPQVFYSKLTNILRIRSRLTINGITDDYAGDYTCNILGEDEYTYLVTSSHYMILRKLKYDEHLVPVMMEM